MDPEGLGQMAQRGRAAGRGADATHAGGPRPGARRGEARRAALPRVDLTALRDRLRGVVEPVVAAEGYDLEELSVSRAGRRHVVRIAVDRDGGLDLDAVATVSRAVSTALDEAEEAGGELLAGEYQLEVGSRGVDRPLTLPRHWRRNVGRLVKVGPMTGRVMAVDDAGVVFDVDGARTVVAHQDLGPGHVQVEFGRAEELADDQLDGIDDGDDDEKEDER